MFPVKNEIITNYQDPDEIVIYMVNGYNIRIILV